MMRDREEDRNEAEIAFVDTGVYYELNGGERTEMNDLARKLHIEAGLTPGTVAEEGSSDDGEWWEL